jgi:CRISPR-associated exonuclease Cas4
MNDRITGIHVAYFHICKRKLWLWAHGLELEEESTDQNTGQQRVAEANVLQDTTYRRRAEAGQQLMLELPGFAGRVDFFDAGRRVVHETKPSDKLAEAHRWQLRFYLWLIRESGLGPATGVLEYPKQKKREHVELSPADEAQLLADFEAIRQLVGQPDCPPVINKPRCKSCAYFDLCYVSESD